MKYLAICHNIFALNFPDDWSKESCDPYPGSHWMIYFKKFAEEQGYKVIQPTECADAITMKTINPKDVQFVQEEGNYKGVVLSNLGAKPSVLFCLESPLYTPVFYDRLNEWNWRFKSQILFGSLGTHAAYFPSFDEHEHAPIPDWNFREKRLCYIASNKHYRSSFQPDKSSKSYDEAVRHQLHDERYDAIKRLSPDVYGRGWPEGVGKEIPPGDKAKVLSEYQYSICYENCSMSGYVTEKIIDCLVAGTVPIYIGAPDIKKYVPGDCFLDSPYDVFGDSAGISKRGQHFLESDLGKKFSYQSFARTVLECVMND